MPAKSKRPIRVAPPSNPAAVAVHPTATKTSVLGESTSTRFVDAGIVAATASATVFYTATRTSAGSQVGAGLLWAGLGALFLVEGRGSLLKYGGAGLLGANAAYLALRAAHPNLAASFIQTEGPPKPLAPIRVGYALVTPT